MKRNDVMIPFNIDQMTVNDMQRSVRALSAIIVRWHAVNEKRQALGSGDLVDDTYDQLTDEFFWDVNAQINQFSTWKLEEEKKND
jgi:hypothetical protein